MTATTFINQQTVIQADWLNDVNNMTYITGPGYNTTKANAGANTDITSLSTVTVPTQSNGTANTAIANTLFVSNAITNTPSVAQLQPISGSVAASALTITASFLNLDFRSTSLASGAITRVANTPSSLVVPSGATLGTTSALASRLAVIALNNAGTIELAVVNTAGGVLLDETNLISTTAISAGSSSASVVYSTTARTSLAYRVIGFIDSTQATAGTWATSPSEIQGAGGQALLRTIPLQSMVRVNTANGYGSTNTMIRRFTNVVTNQGSDITYADSATLGATFTINTNGVYAVSFNDSYTSAEHVGISKNSTQLTTQFFSITLSDKVAAMTTAATNLASNCGVTLYLTAGDVIRAHTTGAAFAGASASMFTITRVS